MMHYSFSWQTRKNYRRALVGCCIFLLGLGSSPAYANPFGGTVVAGQASIQVSGNTVTITQGSNRAVINWQDFSIGANQVTKFNQNSSSAATLNRVTGGNPSAILGKLQANGQVFLINPNGIVVGPGAQINVGAFTASTLDIDNAQFMRGGALDFRGDSTASVINHGNINAVDGGIYLIGAKVENHGLLNAPNGTVGLAAGQHVRLADSAKPHLVVKATSQSIGGTGVLNTGTINALRTELAANGGNVYGLAINNTGTIRATGVETVGGEVYLTSRGGTIQNTGNLIASSVGAATSKVVLDTRSLTGEARTGQTLLAGHIDVSGETGGVAHILGDHVSLTGAEINANGLSGGGEVLIGGGFQGGAIPGDDPFVNANAITTKVDAASTINADAVQNGNGGQVVVWADDATTFAGDIFARGGQQAGNGGLVEVSGLNTLTMGGLVSTRAANGQFGTLLLDPGHFDVNAGAGASMANSIGADTLVGPGFLGNNNVVIATHFGGGADADIRVNAPVLWNEATSLTFLAEGNFRAFASVQNEGGGDVNVVAGWVDQMPLRPDGATSMASFDFDALVMNPALFGQNGGSVFIGDGAQTTNIAVGSRNGATNVAGFDVVLEGGVGAGRVAAAAAQIGYIPSFMQSSSGEITVRAANDVRVLGGTALAHAQIGHGGRTSITHGDFSGAIDVNAGNNLLLMGGPGVGTNPASYAQIGHGGLNRFGEQGAITADIDVTAGQDIALIGGAGGIGNYAQIGNGGFSDNGVRGPIDGIISVNAANNLLLDATPGLPISNGSYTQVGHGGFGQFVGSESIAGNVNVMVGGDASLIGGVQPDAFAQIGHGDASGGASGARMGDIDIRVVGETSLVNGAGAGSPWLIGHATNTAGGVTNADVTLITGTLDYSTMGTSPLFNISGTADGADFAAKMIANLGGGAVTLGATNGNAGSMGGMTVASPFIYDSPNNLSFLSTSDIRFNASVQNGGLTIAPGPTGQVNAVAGWDGVTGVASPLVIGDVFGDAASFGVSGGSVFIGNGMQTTGIAVGSRFGATSVAADDLTVTGSSTTAEGFAQLGFRHDETMANFDIDGSIDVALTGDLVVTGGNAIDSYAQVGHGGDDFNTGIEPDGNFSGAITIQQANNLHFTGGMAENSYAQLGHGGNEMDGDFTGDIQINAVDLNFLGGTANDTYAQLGHGGDNADGDHSGSINVESSGNLMFIAGAGDDAYVQLGHGGQDISGDLMGEITVSADNINFMGGSNDDTFAQLGHGGKNNFGEIMGDIGLSASGDLTFVGGSGEDAYAQLGHGGIGNLGFQSGDITVLSANDITFQGGDDFNAYAKLGHGGAFSFGSQDGDIRIASANNILFEGGSFIGTTAQLGHGGVFSFGDQTGNITIEQANDITFNAGSGFDASAQLGHGGLAIFGDQTGYILINKANDISFTGGTNLGAFALLGHGGTALESESESMPMGGFSFANQTGNITIASANDATFEGGSDDETYSQLGHGGLNSVGNQTGNIYVRLVGSDLFLTAGATDFSYAQLGHGDASGNGTGTRTGDITVIIDGTASLTGASPFSPAWLGHRSANSASVSGNLLLAVDQADPLSDGGGRLLMNNTFTAIDMAGAPNQVRIFDSRRDGPSPQFIAEGAIINGVPFTNFAPTAPGTRTAAAWRPNTEFTSWDGEQWGSDSSEFTVANPGPYTGPFTFFFLGEKPASPSSPVTPMMPIGSTTPEMTPTIPNTLLPIEIYWSWTAHEFLARTLFETRINNHTPQISAEESERPEGEIAGESSP